MPAKATTSEDGRGDRPDAALARREHLILALLQGLHRIDPRRLPRRNERGDHAGRHADQQRRDKQHRARGNVLGALCHTVRVVDEIANRRRDAARNEQAEQHAADGADQARNRALAQKQPANLLARRAERAEDADLRTTLGDRNRERVVDDEHADEERKQARDPEIGRAHV